MKKVIIFLSFLILFSSNILGQRLYIGNELEIKATAIDTTEQIIYVFSKNFYKKVDIQTFDLDSLKLHTDEYFDYSNYEPLVIKNNVLFFSKEGGLVYQLKNDSIKRIDNSFNHKMQSYSSIFQHNDTVYKYGGYGFWDTRNIFTYYNSSINEWEVLHTNPSKTSAPKLHSAIHIKHSNDIYFIYGIKVDEFNRHKSIVNNNIWKFNFETKTWENLGVANPVIKSWEQLVIGGQGRLYSQKFAVNDSNGVLYIFNNTVNPFSFITIHPLENKISTYNINDAVYKKKKDLNSFFWNNRFYVFYTSTRHSDKIYLSSFYKDELLKNIVSETYLYEEQFNWLKPLVYVIIFILITSVIILKIKKRITKRNKIVLLETGLKYKNNYVELDYIALTCLKLLLSKNEINSNELLEIISEKQYSPAHNERLKVQKIEELELKLQTLTNTKNSFITNQKSKLDKRYRVYILEKSYFNF